MNYHGDPCKRVNYVGPCNRVISCLCKRAKRFRYGNTPVEMGNGPSGPWANPAYYCSSRAGPGQLAQQNTGRVGPTKCGPRPNAHQNSPWAGPPTSLLKWPDLAHQNSPWADPPTGPTQPVKIAQQGII